MPPTPLNRDPEGYYAQLGVDPWATPDRIISAYRRKARLVHPDVPGTGDTRAFVALKQAYDVLIRPDLRAAYDRLSLPRATDSEPGEIYSTPRPDMEVPRTRHPRLGDLPAMVWVGMVAVLMVGAVEIGLHLRSSTAPAHRESIPARARDVPPAELNAPPAETYGPAPVRLAGTPNFYVIATAMPVVLWRADEAKHTLVPWGQLPAFSAVQGLRVLRPSGLVEVKVTDTATGFIESDRLTPGDSAAAARAWCTFHAGPTPSNGEVLTQTGDGPRTLQINNRSGQPAVVKLRSAEGTIVASVFLGPDGETTLGRLPDTPLRLDYATGEAWSRACHGFAAGMRALRLTKMVNLGALPRLSIPPPDSVASADLADQAFEQE
jgi:hypothetical protein